MAYGYLAAEERGFVKLRILGLKAFVGWKKRKWHIGGMSMNEKLLWSLSFLFFFSGAMNIFMNFVAS